VLGTAGLEVPVMGLGAWSWGDRSGYWGYGTEYGKEESRRAYKVGPPVTAIPML
jgi:aryl-alcohol dehydrogenase-like predicted oxidoreductase